MLRSRCVQPFLNRSSSLFRGGPGSRPKVRTRSRAAARSDRPCSAAHRSITSPFWPQRLVEALEDVVLQVDAEGAAAAVAAMDRTGAAPLRAAAAQPRRQAELIEHPRQRQLLLEVGEVDGGALADRAGFGYSCRHRPR